MKRPTLSQQRGSVLITTLVILTAVTTIAVLSMQKSTTNTRMVGNTQLFENSFQIAMSELDSKFEEYRQAAVNPQLQQAIQARSTNNPLVDVGGTPNPNAALYSQINSLVIESNLEYKGGINNIDHTLSSDNSIGMIKKYTFILSTNARINNANIYSKQEKEFSFLGRKPN